MSNVVLLVSADGGTETKMNLAEMNPANRPVRISLPEGAVIEARDAMSGEWLPFMPGRHQRHPFTDFSILDK